MRGGWGGGGSVGVNPYRGSEGGVHLTIWKTWIVK